MQNNAKMV